MYDIVGINVVVFFLYVNLVENHMQITLDDEGDGDRKLSFLIIEKCKYNLST